MTALRRYRSALLALTISAVCLALSLRAVDAGQVSDSLADAHYGWALLASLVATGVVFVRAMRWWMLYRARTPVPAQTAVSASSIALMVNAVLPFRGVSTVLRAYLVRRNAGVPIVTSIGSITVERFWEVSSQAITIALVLVAVDLPGWTTTGGIVLLAVNVLMLMVLAALWAFPSPTSGFIQRVLGRFSPRAAAASIVHFNAFRDGIAALGHLRVLAGVTACTVVIAAGQGLAVWLALRAFALDVPAAVAWAIYIGVTFGLALPSAPAGIGTFQFVVVSILAGFAVTESQALTASFVIQATLLGPPIAMGILFLAGEGLSLASIAGRGRIRRTFEAPSGIPLGQPIPSAARVDSEIR